MTTSVLTIVRGRQTHLENQLIGLLQSDLRPHAWIIVGMDQDVQLQLPHDLNVRTGRVEGDGRNLPLAAARNLAVRMCDSERMIFLDVDCIASPGMIEVFDNALAREPRLWMGRPTYLSPGMTARRWTMQQLAADAIEHPLQPSNRDGQAIRSDQYELFWSLCFGITRTDFERIGGFDESFRGYGGEDTDFAFSARAAGVPFGFVAATAYHQHHAVHDPPLNHFGAIIGNAIRFYEKWGVLPMMAWLEAFATMGLIDLQPQRGQIRVLRSPSPSEIDATKRVAESLQR